MFFFQVRHLAEWILSNYHYDALRAVFKDYPKEEAECYLYGATRFEGGRAAQRASPLTLSPPRCRCDHACGAAIAKPGALTSMINYYRARALAMRRKRTQDVRVSKVPVLLIWVRRPPRGPSGCASPRLTRRLA